MLSAVLVANCRQYWYSWCHWLYQWHQWLNPGLYCHASGAIGRTHNVCQAQSRSQHQKIILSLLATDMVA